MSRTFLGFVLVFAALGLPAPAAQQPDQLSANDKDFVEFAGQTDLATVRLARLAELQASSPQVKHFALTLEQEHNAGLKKLTAVADKTGGIAPDTLDDSHLSAVKQLNKSKGKSFDHAFLKVIVREHENALVSYAREAGHGFNPDLQAFAKSRVPKFEAHLKAAKQLDAAD